MTQDLVKESEKNLTLVEKLRLRRTGVVLLLDTSGSMSSDCEPGVPKIKALRDIVTNLPGNPQTFWFNDRFGDCEKHAIPDPRGSTYLAQALRTLKAGGHHQIILITDGDITDKDATLAEMPGMTVKPMYVGSGTRPVFLDKLAEMSGGFATSHDLVRDQKLISEKLVLLLGPGQEKPRGAFEL